MRTLHFRVSWYPGPSAQCPSYLVHLSPLCSDNPGFFWDSEFPPWDLSPASHSMKRVLHPCPHTVQSRTGSGPRKGASCITPHLETLPCPGQGSSEANGLLPRAASDTMASVQPRDAGDEGGSAAATCSHRVPWCCHSIPALQDKDEGSVCSPAS